MLAQRNQPAIPLPTDGLSGGEARRKIAESGPNAMPDTSGHLLRMLLDHPKLTGERPGMCLSQRRVDGKFLGDGCRGRWLFLSDRHQ
jgi:hypothetical protein